LLFKKRYVIIFSNFGKINACCWLLFLEEDNMAILNVKDIFHDLHQIPEIGFQEFKTSAYLADKLRELGYKVTTNVGGTGVVGVVKGAEPGPVMLLRADMDALPFVINGEHKAIHACGHDAHCSMVLAAASNLKDKIKKGTLKILFQQGEETLKGALAVIDAGVLEDVDIAVGLHIRPVQDLPFGKLSPAVRHASSTFAKVKITGQSCHGSRPHLGVNAVEVAAAVINAASGVRINPVISWSCKATAVNGGGNAYNIIPDHAEITFDVRCQENEGMTELLGKLQKAAENVAAAYGATAEFSLPGGVIPAAVLDKELTAEVAECIKEVVGEENLGEELVNPGGEDFHYFAKTYPKLKSAYFGVGVAAEPGLHDPNMHFNIDGLQAGVEVLEKITLKKLG
jgi:amidohydrolase